MSVRLFIYKEGGAHVASFTADAVPRAGETLWCKTLGSEDTLIVESVEHQFDKSEVGTYGNHDVALYCKTK